MTTVAFCLILSDFLSCVTKIIMRSEAEQSKSSTSKWPLLYSVEIQTSLMYLLTVYVSLLAPFPDSPQENEHLNFIYDFIYEKLERVQVKFLSFCSDFILFLYQLTSTKFSSFVLLGLIYGPIKLFLKNSNSIPPINVLLISKTRDEKRSYNQPFY